MKKLAILFGLVVLSSQLPLSPSRALPGNLLSSLEYGRQWSGMFLQAFGPVDAAQAPSPAAKPAAARESCPLAAMASMEVPAPAEAPALPEPSDLPSAPAAMQIDVTVPAVANLKPVIVQVKAPFDQQQVSAEVAKEMAKAMIELRTQLKELDAAHREIELQRRIQTRSLKAGQHLEKVRIVVTKSA